MGKMQEIQGRQVIQILNNDIYDSAGSNSSSSYVSASGIKSVLLTAWNTVKSAVSGMLSSFGLHLSGQQGRDITMDMSSRPVQPLPGIDDLFDNTLYGSNNDDDIYSEIDENVSSEIDDPASHIYEDPDVYRVVNDETGTAEAGDPANHIYEDPDVYRVVSGETGTAEADDPENHIYEDVADYRVTGNVIDSEDRVLVCDDIYAEPENIYSKPYNSGNTVSTPHNDQQQLLPTMQN